MKRCILPLFATILITLTGCNYDDIHRLDGYLYMKAAIVEILTYDGKTEHKGPQISMTEANTQRYIVINGKKFVPYLDHKAGPYKSLKFSPAVAFTFDPDADQESVYMVSNISGDGPVYLIGTTVLDFIRSGDGDPQDNNGDGKVDAEDLVVISGVPCPIDKNYFFAWLNELPITVTTSLVYEHTDKEHLDAWLAAGE